MAFDAEKNYNGLINQTFKLCIFQNACQVKNIAKDNIVLKMPLEKINKLNIQNLFCVIFTVIYRDLY